MLTAEATTARFDPVSIFAALGDETRLSLLTTLSDGRPRSITALSGDARMTRQAVTKHLRVLENAGLVCGARHGRETHFAYEPKHIENARSYLDQVSRQWDEALGRLKHFVEDDGCL